MRELIKSYVKEELKKLKYVGDKIYLDNVNPILLEEVIGDFENPYELDGYECNYWTNVGDYSVFGTMRFGTAVITLVKGEIRIEEKSSSYDGIEISENKLEEIIPEGAENWDTFYFTFGYGQMYFGKYQPIKAENQSKAHKKMVEIYGTDWSFVYTEDEWHDVLDMDMSKPLDLIYAV